MVAVGGPEGQQELLALADLQKVPHHLPATSP